jgi:2-polyprenyl-3-methyl-5-hydroxy-6-metoxy-1,4-benzoquinol methylase
METDKVRLVNRCPACEGERYVRRVAIDDKSRERYRSFSEIKYGGLLNGWMAELQPEIVVCSDCGHHWYLRQPSPEQLSLMYGNGRRLLPGAVSREPTQEMLADMRRLAKLIGKEQPRLLDFGSGFGRWARAAARAGFRVHAYEPSETRGAESVEEFTLAHDLSEIAGNSFDAINLEQVLEHVPDPVEILQNIKAFCTANTVLRIRVPNILRPPEGAKVWVDWPYDGKRVHAMAPFEHLHGFTPNSLRCVLERSGFRFLAAHTLLGNYPATAIRQLIGRWVPQVAQTLALVNPADG